MLFVAELSTTAAATFSNARYTKVLMFCSYIHCAHACVATLALAHHSALTVCSEQGSVGAAMPVPKVGKRPT
jgi:hypothetical protein